MTTSLSLMLLQYGYIHALQIITIIIIKRCEWSHPDEKHKLKRLLQVSLDQL